MVPGSSPGGWTLMLISEHLKTSHCVFVRITITRVNSTGAVTEQILATFILSICRTILFTAFRYGIPQFTYYSSSVVNKGISNERMLH